MVLDTLYLYAQSPFFRFASLLILSNLAFSVASSFRTFTMSTSKPAMIRVRVMVRVFLDTQFVVDFHRNRRRSEENSNYKAEWNVNLSLYLLTVW